MQSRAEHVANAQRAYAKLLTLQARIEAFEETVSKAWPDNDRLIANYMKNSDDPGVFVYNQLCKLRDIQRDIIATEAQMAGLYRD